MSKATQRKGHSRRDRGQVEVVVHRPGEASWAVAVQYVDGTVQVDGFDSEVEARRMVAVVLPELERVDPGVRSVALQDCASGEVVQRWGEGDA